MQNYQSIRVKLREAEELVSQYTEGATRLHLQKELQVSRNRLVKLLQPNDYET